MPPLPIGKYLREVERAAGDHGLNIVFFCPACSCGHGVSTRAPGPVWKISGTPEAPTIEPSVKCEVFADEGKILVSRCHSVITAGQIAFAPDSTHALSGQTVPMVEF